MSRFSLLLLIALLPSVAVGGLPPLISDSEIAAIEARLLAEIEGNRTRTCVRPVLRGRSAAGLADTDIVGVVEGNDGLRECYDFIQQFDDVLFGPPDAANERQTGLMARFSKVCASLPPAIERATAHDDACSPYLPGRRPMPGLRGTQRILRAARHLAALVVLSGRTGEAADRFLDIVRFAQDLGRGGAPLVMTMLATSVIREILSNDLPQLLARPELTDEDLARIRRGLGQLIETEPSLQRSIVADITWLAYEAGLPLLREPGWAPPGGYSVGNQTPPADYEPALLPLVTPGQERRFILAAIMDLGLRYSEACPEGATLAECYLGLRAMTEAVMVRRSIPGWLRILQTLIAPSPWEAWRRHLTELVQEMLSVSFETYVPGYTVRSFFLAALRLQVAVLQEARRTGRCPTAEDLATPAWHERIREPSVGGAFMIRTGASGGIVVESAAPIWQAAEESPPVLPIKCVAK